MENIFAISTSRYRINVSDSTLGAATELEFFGGRKGNDYLNEIRKEKTRVRRSKKKEKEDKEDFKSKTTAKQRRVLYRAVQRAIDNIPNRYVSCCTDESMSTADIRAALDSLALKGIIEWRSDHEAFKIKKVDLD